MIKSYVRFELLPWRNKSKNIAIFLRLILRLVLLLRYQRRMISDCFAVYRKFIIPLAAEFIYLATSAECAGPINRSTAVKWLKQRTVHLPECCNKLFERYYLYKRRTWIAIIRYKSARSMLDGHWPISQLVIAALSADGLPTCAVADRHSTHGRSIEMQNYSASYAWTSVAPINEAWTIAPPWLQRYVVHRCYIVVSVR